MQAPDGGLRLGMMGGYNRDRMRGQGQADVDSYHAGVYGGGAIGEFLIPQEDALSCAENTARLEAARAWALSIGER